MQDIFPKVREIIAESLAVDPENVTPDASLMKELGAESIDFLEIVFQLEKEFDVQIPRGEIERQARGDLTNDEFEIAGVLTDKGLARLQELMPEADDTAFRPGMKTREIPALFTAATFARMVEDKLADAAPTARSRPRREIGAEGRP